MVRPQITLIGIKEMEGEDLQDLFTPGDRQERVQIEAFFFSVLDPSGPSLLLFSGDPRTRKEARLRAGSPQEAWSPAARDAAAVERWRRTVRCGSLRESEREREAVKLDLSWLTAVKGNGWFTLGKGIFFVDALFPLTPLRSRQSVKL
jgi:hypothetical protein